eukprot:1899353-Rhodomonas_salina.2
MEERGPSQKTQVPLSVHIWYQKPPTGTKSFALRGSDTSLVPHAFSFRSGTNLLHSTARTLPVQQHCQQAFKTLTPRDLSAGESLSHQARRLRVRRTEFVSAVSDTVTHRVTVSVTYCHQQSLAGNCTDCRPGIWTRRLTAGLTAILGGCHSVST